MKVPELLCLLNPIFNVNFEKTALFKRLTEVQKNIATKKMIKQLCYGVNINLALRHPYLSPDKLLQFRGYPSGDIPIVIFAAVA